MSAPDLCALVSARLCHDLISPMGAIGNGLELLELSSGAGTEEITLIAESLDTALAKLRFFRIAFGPTDSSAPIRAEEIVAITDAMFSGRISVKWSDLPDDPHRPLVRMAFLAILCLEKSLPMGGIVRSSLSEDTVKLSVEGRRVAAPAELWSHLRDGRPVPDLRPDAVQFALLRCALETTGTGFAAELSETGASVTLGAMATQPA